MNLVRDLRRHTDEQHTELIYLLKTEAFCCLEEKNPAKPLVPVPWNQDYLISILLSFFLFLCQQGNSRGKRQKKIIYRTQNYLNLYAADGLRTLCIAKKVTETYVKNNKNMICNSFVEVKRWLFILVAIWRVVFVAQHRL